MILAVIKTVQDLFVSESAHFRPHNLGFCQITRPLAGFTASRKSAGLDTGCYTVTAKGTIPRLRGGASFTVE
jgi:hypothetical protein